MAASMIIAKLKRRRYAQMEIERAVTNPLLMVMRRKHAKLTEEGVLAKSSIGLPLRGGLNLSQMTRRTRTSVFKKGERGG